MSKIIVSMSHTDIIKDQLALEIIQYEKTSLFDILINLILVAEEGRNATLVEFNGMSEEKRAAFEPIVNRWIQRLHLRTAPDPFSNDRLFVFKKQQATDFTHQSEIAAFLGFYAVGHHYGDVNVFRLVGSIYEGKTGRNIYAEVCEKSKTDTVLFEDSLKKKVHIFNKIMVQWHLSYYFEDEITELPTWQWFIDHYNDRCVVKEHLHDYACLLYNEFYPGTIFNKDPQFIVVEWSLFVFLMDQIKKGYFRRLYDKHQPFPSIFVDKMESMEHQLLKSPRHSYRQILKSFS